MNKMKLANRIKRFFDEDAEYFRSSQASIGAHNSKMLCSSCLIYACVLTFYTVLTVAIKDSRLLLNMYLAFDAIHVALCGAIYFYFRQPKRSFRTTQTLCAIFEISLLSFFLLEGVFYSKTEHSLYIPIAILLTKLVFVHPAVYSNCVTVVYLLAFGILTRLYKTPEAYTHDILIAMATLISTTIGYVLVAEMQHSENAIRSQFERLSKTDVLTGLLNKSTMESLCQRAIAEEGQGCALLIVDLDDFKSVNDIHGHAVGDEVLHQVGSSIVKSFRSGDYMGRFGGDEFIILMNNCNDRQIVEARAAQVIRRVAELRYSASELRVECSVGIAVKAPGDSFDTLFSRADRALYNAKRNGKGSFCIDACEV